MCHIEAAFAAGTLWQLSIARPTPTSVLSRTATPQAFFRMFYVDTEVKFPRRGVGLRVRHSYTIRYPPKFDDCTESGRHSPQVWPLHVGHVPDDRSMLSSRRMPLQIPQEICPTGLGFWRPKLAESIRQVGQFRTIGFHSRQEGKESNQAMPFARFQLQLSCSLDSLLHSQPWR
jgi:hypothetical protein